MATRRRMTGWLVLGVLVVGFAGCAGGRPPAGPPMMRTPAAQASPPAGPPPAPALPPDPWPRDVTLPNADALIYQPQVDSWDGNALAWRVAVALRPSGQKDETFGVLWGTARTEVDRTTRSVELHDVVVTKANFPTLPGNGQAYLPGLYDGLKGALATMALDSLETSLAASRAAKPGGMPVRNDPPRIIVSYTPALLIPISGSPVLRPISGTSLDRVINTEAMLARAGAGTYYLHVYDGWLRAPSLQGPWTLPAVVPAGLEAAARHLAASGVVDLIEGSPSATPRPSLAAGVPAIHVTESAAELIVFKGQPNFVPVGATGLLWATNSAIDVLIDTRTSDYYVLISGRWFRAPGLGGPWTFVASDALPAAFTQIPPTGTPASVVLASVAGTPQAEEAVIANSIPQTATVLRVGGPTFTPAFDGAPVYQTIPGTPLTYVINSKIPVIEVSPTSFYAVEAGVWFTAPAVTGPWAIATSVPEVIYTIPVTSPLHYVTYVRVYGFTPTVVYVGYTPGYLGTVVTATGVVVYGTGYIYQPWVGTVWYAAPVTYGVAAVPVYNPAVGWSYGFAMGLATAAIAEPYWGGAYYHAGYYGYPCCGSVSANVYRNWGWGTSSGTRTWYDNPGGSFGTTASGTYSTARGTTGTYSGQRSWNPYTGQGSQGYTRTATGAAGGSGTASRSETYNAQTGQRTYDSSVSATGPGGSSIDRNVQASAGPDGYSRSASTTTYNANTGQTKAWNNGVPDNTHYAGSDGNVYKNDGSGWQQHSSSGWQSAPGTTAGASQEQQARSAAQNRTSSFGSGGWDRSGSGTDSWGSRFGGGDLGSSWGNRFGGEADRLGGGGGAGSWGSRFSSGGFGDRFGGFGGRFGGFRR
jgi:hypothetical protein